MDREPNKKSKYDVIAILKFSIVIAFLILYVVYTIYLCITVSWWSLPAMGFTLLFIGYLILERSNGDIEIYSGLAMAASVFAVLSVFNASNVMKTEYMEKNVNLFVESLSIKRCPQSVQPNIEKRKEFNQLKEILMPKCMMQNNSDTMALVVDVMKARHLDPVTGLIDNVYNQFDKNKELNCIEVAKKMDLLCPEQNFLFADL